MQQGATLADLKSAIADKQGMPPAAQQKPTLGDAPLTDDAKAIADFGIKPKSTVMLAGDDPPGTNPAAPDGDGKVPLFVATDLTGNEPPLALRVTLGVDTIADVKNMVHTANPGSTPPPAEQKLAMPGVAPLPPADDAKTTDVVGVLPGGTLILAPPPPLARDWKFDERNVQGVIEYGPTVLEYVTTRDVYDDDARVRVIEGEIRGTAEQPRDTQQEALAQGATDALGVGESKHDDDTAAGGGDSADNGGGGGSANGRMRLGRFSATFKVVTTP